MEWQRVCVLTPIVACLFLPRLRFASSSAVRPGLPRRRRPRGMVVRFWSSNAMAFAAAMRSPACRARSAGCSCPPSAKSISPSRRSSVSPSASAPPWRHAAGLATVLSLDGGLGYREIEGAQVRAQLNRDGARSDA